MGWFEWLGGSHQKNYSGFESCCLFLTSTPSFIKIGPKLAKLVFWGRLVGKGVKWLGWLGGSDKKINTRLELCCPFLTFTPSFIKIGPKLAKLVF